MGRRPLPPAAHADGGQEEQRVADGRGPPPGLQVRPLRRRQPEAAHRPGNSGE